MLMHELLFHPALQINALKKQGIYEKSVVILTSKHGNSPIDPSTLVRVDPAVRSSLRTLIPITRSLRHAVILHWKTESYQIPVALTHPR